MLLAMSGPMHSSSPSKAERNRLYYFYYYYYGGSPGVR